MSILDGLLQSGRAKGTRGFYLRHNALDELEPKLCSLFEGLITQKEQIMHIISAPSQMVLEKRQDLRLWMKWSATPAYYLVMTSQRMLVAAVAQPGAEPDVHIFHLSEILTMEFGKILLYAWLEWSWSAGEHVKRLRVHFNTVGEELFHRLVVDICRNRIELTGLKSADNSRNLNLLDHLPYKFKNIIAGRLLLPDEAVRGVVFRDAIWSCTLRVFRRLRAPALALVLTNFHLLAMHEDFGSVGSKYGVIFRYFPLDSILRARLQQEDKQTRLDLVLRNNGARETLQLLFNEDDRVKLQEMLLYWIMRE